MQTITVNVRAGARTEHLEEIAPHTFKVRVQIAPEKGKATKRVTELLAQHYDVPISSVTLLSGLTSHTKKFSISTPS